jgi:mannose-6-phosphate isomerase-like protein (cupin superfamily)
MEVRELDRNRRFSAEKMTKINLFETPRFFLDQYCLEPGQAQKLHRHAENDKVYIVLEGQGRFQVGDEERVLGPHQAVLAPAGVQHGVVNPTSERLVLLTFMAPHPGWVEGKVSGGDQPVSEGKRAAS